MLLAIRYSTFLHRPFASHLARAVGHLVLVLAFFALVTAGTAYGQTRVWQGDDGADPTNWDVDANWLGDTPPSASENVDFVGSTGKTIDLMGTDRTVANVTIENMDNAALFQSTGGAATLNFIDLQTRENKSQATFNIDLDGGRLHNERKSQNLTFNGSLTLSDPTSGPAQRTWHMNGPASFTGGLDFAYRSINIGSNPVINANDTVTFGAALNISDRATWNTNVDGGMGSGTINVSDLGRLAVNTAQTALPTINVNAFAVLSGMVKNPSGTHLANYSATGAGNVNLVENSILALDPGETEPTEADLGLTPGVQDALIWKGATATGTTSAGDDGNSVYKGVAVGQFTPTYYDSSNTYTTPIGDLTVAVVHNDGGANARYKGAKFDSPTGVANIDMYGTSEITLRQSLKGTATEFHFRNQGNVDRTIVTFDLDAVTAAQEVHIHDGGLSIGSGAAPDIKGRLELHGDTMTSFTADQIVPDADTMIVLNDNAALSVNTSEESVLELLTPGTNVIVNSPTPVVYLESVGGGYDFTGATSGTPNPVMMQLLTASNLVVSSSNNQFFALNEDLTLGDGKYFINYGSSHKGMTLGNVGDPGQVAADTGASSIGIANFGAPDAGSGSMKINATIDGGGTATIRLGSSTPLTAVRGTNQRATQIPSGRIELNSSAAFINTPEVAIESGTVQLNAPVSFPTNLTLNGGTLDTNGNTATVNGTLGGSGTWSGTVEVSSSGAFLAPGAGAGTISGDTLTFQTGAAYSWEFQDENGPAGTGWDLADLSGLLTLADSGNDTQKWTFDIVDAGGVPDPAAEYDVFNYGTLDAAVSGNLLTGVTITNSGGGYDISGAQLLFDDAGAANRIYLTGLAPAASAVIPEPSTLMLSALGALALAALAWRRRR